jgi:hypothetical protein
VFDGRVIGCIVIVTQRDDSPGIERFDTNIWASFFETPQSLKLSDREREFSFGKIVVHEFLVHFSLYRRKSLCLDPQASQ